MSNSLNLKIFFALEEYKQFFLSKRKWPTRTKNDQFLVNYWKSQKVLEICTKWVTCWSIWCRRIQWTHFWGHLKWLWTSRRQENEEFHVKGQNIQKCTLWNNTEIGHFWKSKNNIILEILTFLIDFFIFLAFGGMKSHPMSLKMYAFNSVTSN